MLLLVCRVKGTLDHGRIHERVPIPTTSSSRTTGTGDGFSSSDNNGGGGSGAVNGHSSGGREYYNLTNNEKYSRGRRLKNKADSFDFTSQSEEILDEFGDVVVVRSKPKQNSSSAHASPRRIPNKNLYSYSSKAKGYNTGAAGGSSGNAKRNKGHRSSSDEDDGWTTEF